MLRLCASLLLFFALPVLAIDFDALGSNASGVTSMGDGSLINEAAKLQSQFLDKQFDTHYPKAKLDNFTCRTEKHDRYGTRYSVCDFTGGFYSLDYVDPSAPSDYYRVLVFLKRSDGGYAVGRYVNGYGDWEYKACRGGRQRFAGSVQDVVREIVRSCQ